MATQDDMLTAQKNQVVATNGLNQTWINNLRSMHGDSTSSCLDAASVVKVGSGRLVSVSVVEAGTTQGFIYDAASANSPDKSTRLMAIPQTEGVYQASFMFTNGLFVAPGDGQAVTITYSTD
jgi:hypothetical protein